MPKQPAQTFNDINIPQADSEYLRQKLKVKHLEAKDKFKKKYPHAEKYLKEKGVELGKVRQHSAKIIGASALTGSLMLLTPSEAKALPSPQEVIDKFKDDFKSSDKADPQGLLVENLEHVLPAYTRPLGRNEEKFLEQLFSNIIGINARASLEGEHLNTTYGLIGAEQHLPRYPGDVAQNHEMSHLGITPNRGAWGYFAQSKDTMTDNLEEKEIWYSVVQTMYIHDWNTRQPYLKNWYKHRKMLIVNTLNGKAVVTALADAGPAAWTGKSFGGSPEVMDYLGGPRYKKGPVVIFFVDDPNNKVPLGPVEYGEKGLSELAYLRE